MEKIKKINLNGTNYLVGPTHVSELENDKGYFVATTDGDGKKFLANDGTYKEFSGNIPVFDTIDQLDGLKVGEIASVLASGDTPIDWDKVIAETTANNGATDIRISSFTVNTDYSGGTSEPQSEFDFVVGLLNDFIAPTRYLYIAIGLDVNNADIGYIAYTNPLDENFGIRHVLQDGTWDHNELRTLQSMVVPGDFIQAMSAGENPVPTSLIEKAFSVTTGGGSPLSTFVKTEDGYTNLLAMLTKEQAKDMFATKNEVPTKVSQLENDANYFVDAKPLPENGIYIYDIDGNFVNPSAWDTTNNSKAVGVAVLDDNCKFVIAKEDVPQGEMLWGDYTQVLPLIEDQFNDFDGVSNTSAIVSAYGTSYNYAALACTQYTFANGQHGYLGAYGEWNIIKSNIDTINNALSLISGNTFSNICYWTSTEIDEYDAYHIDVYSFGLGMYDKHSSRLVRAFLHIDSTKSILQRLDEIETKSGAYKLVDSIANVLQIKPNTFYNFGLAQRLEISFADTIPGVVNEYVFQFTSYNETRLSLPDTVKWANDTPPTITEGKTYQISIVNNLATVLEFN